MATKQNWRHILLTNRSSVLMLIELDTGLFEELKNHDVFPWYHLGCIWFTQIMREKTTSQRAEILLGFLERKSFLDFQKFCEALERTGQRRLVRDYLSSVGEYDFQLPASVNQTSLSNSVAPLPCQKQEARLNFKRISVDNAELRQRINEEFTFGRAYRCNRIPRGRAVIIINEFFVGDNLGYRERSWNDVCLLEDLFKFLHFDIKVHENKTDEEILKILNDESKDKGNYQYDMFVLFIMSHGLHGGVYGINGRLVKTEEIMELFDGENCPSLCNKPKLIFIQACQGVLNTLGDALDAIIYQDDTAPSETVHVKEDMALIYATVKDQMAWRRRDTGSLFIRYINEVFRSKAGEEDFMSMITEVFERLHNHADDSHHYNQIGEKFDRLRRKVYLLP